VTMSYPKAISVHDAITQGVHRRVSAQGVSDKRIGGAQRVYGHAALPDAQGCPVVAALDRQRARQARDRLKAGTARQDHGLIFATSIGTPFEHACATFLLAEGVEPRTARQLSVEAVRALGGSRRCCGHRVMLGSW
jgi:hypothetical protein